MSVACWNQAALAPEPPLGPSAGLPSSFLHSLWTLFEILDEEGKGFVHLSEIESRWRQQDGDDRLPAGVLLALRQVGAPCAGYLTFPRLVAGLQIALLRDEERQQGGHGAPGGEAKEAGNERDRAGWQGPELNPQKQERKRSSNYGNCDRRGIGRSRSINSALSQWDPHRIHRARGELRRHTITNGIDYNALKRMKELEQEKDCLLHGLEMVEHARDWYHQQILGVKEEQKNIGQNLSNNTSFSYQPANGLAPPFTQAAKGLGFQQQAMNVLKEQNRLLAKEVSEKSDRITQLEQENVRIFKQLKESRSHRHQGLSHKESTFI
ncbi:suppressor APC domain-containing protein 2 isoform X2 [Latimeria chalumnae]|uniref:suppressor APC domain-containing protein 2 isoform X2 n=1 Tax=Latimeria chalumnae TaxID=7897 RepID=UPI0006D8F119|nr:PREDICTED: suppressor APC domain-containing protein 1 isoform X2 [Latimeria chalumnae]|eukprot:XP_014345233.1 PREDICTED: suppressor APC domain-containing protein 1 isoform X2 [Latimeria chalumnae]